MFLLFNAYVVDSVDKAIQLILDVYVISQRRNTTRGQEGNI